MDPVTITALMQGAQQANNMVSNIANAGYEYLIWNRNKKAAIEQWNRQNEYDSPANQMKRYQDAGLNPNLIYGGMQKGSSIDIPTPGAQELFRPTNFDPMAIVNAKKVGLETDNIAKQNQILETQNQILQIEKDTKQFDYLKKLKYDMTAADLANQYVSADIKSKLKDVDIKKLQEQIMPLTLENETKRINAEIQNWKISNEIARKNLNREIQKTAAEVSLNATSAKEIQERTKSIILERNRNNLKYNSELMGTPKDSPWYIYMLQQGTDMVTDFFEKKGPTIKNTLTPWYLKRKN